MNLEKRCINKTFPQVVTEEDEKCKNPSCKGYDKFCPQYVPTSAFSQEIQSLSLTQETKKGGRYNG